MYHNLVHVNYQGCMSLYCRIVLDVCFERYSTKSGLIRTQPLGTQCGLLWV